MRQRSPQPFLRIPPFPRRRVTSLAIAADGTRHTRDEIAAFASALRSAKVGGTFWGARPELPDGRRVLLVPSSPQQAWQLQDAAAERGEAASCILIGPHASRHAIPVMNEECDPWHLVAHADRVVADADSEMLAVAALFGRPATSIDDGPWAGLTDANAAAETILRGWNWIDPFTGKSMGALEAAALLESWRELIDANRGIDAIAGVADWKRVTTDALLWGGAPAFRDRRYRKSAWSLDKSSRIATWKSRTAPAVMSMIERSGGRIGEIEDGFIRSVGLGANCVPPLSIIVDWSGVYFDPSGPSDLEAILAEADIPKALQDRAARLRGRLVSAGIGKYGRSTERVEIGKSGRRRVLVPGQVADDRSLASGGGGLTNLGLLQKARELEPDAWIIFRPHPDVEAGHRAGYIAEDRVLVFADEIDRSGPIAGLMESVDAVHTLTSLAGFEALMRGKQVTTHGTPFYSGWGLTRDLAPQPPRRGRKRSLDELVAATLILYPRYLDPVTRLPCPAEIVADRLDNDHGRISSPLVLLREVQGRAIIMGRTALQFVRGTS